MIESDKSWFDFDDDDDDLDWSVMGKPIPQKVSKKQEIEKELQASWGRYGFRNPYPSSDLVKEWQSVAYSVLDEIWRLCDSYWQYDFTRLRVRHKLAAAGILQARRLYDIQKIDPEFTGEVFLNRYHCSPPGRRSRLQQLSCHQKWFCPYCCLASALRSYGLWVTRLPNRKNGVLAYYQEDFRYDGVTAKTAAETFDFTLLQYPYRLRMRKGHPTAAMTWCTLYPVESGNTRHKECPDRLTGNWAGERRYLLFYPSDVDMKLPRNDRMYLKNYDWFSTKVLARYVGKVCQFRRNLLAKRFAPNLAALYRLKRDPRHRCVGSHYPFNVHSHYGELRSKFDNPEWTF
ncbi:hypothetical protein Plim_1095 [Planctopirus limnophila DSM 3776]|uniref:Uncharacterized protein n=1 Tax=Planctopirus limnophila (strain ATCC 43296 / DSM 3776 / IFAM 1008 / Mu 290) TaxID=521674 RepID=D5STU7_PLAL2|nr:hypothetical protein [Planctopirus limnophila]ADG66932.1 hypothetical protein Plim_1095 [Planctopirus limnophila DSM 3776]